MNILMIIIDLITTATLYMAYPFWRFSGKDTKYTKSVLIKNLLFNSLIASIVIILIGITLFKNTYEPNNSFAPAVAYYWINYFIWKRKSHEQKFKSKKEYLKNTYGSFIIVIILLFVILSLISIINHFINVKKEKDTRYEKLTECLQYAEMGQDLTENVYCKHYQNSERCSNMMKNYQEAIEECIQKWGSD